LASAIRRVITGKDSTGRAVAMIDAPAATVHERRETGITNTILWVTDGIPVDLSERADAADRKVGVVPPAGGTIFKVIEFAPQKVLQSDYETRLRIFRGLGLAPEGEFRGNARDPGMHRTKTIDYVLILSGEIDMQLDDSEVHLKAGDVVVQRGTNHAWVNRENEPCKVAFILIDAKE
jgi:mannose-6-phosphate isomerase-like protein (cupin superfamily)